MAQFSGELTEWLTFDAEEEVTPILLGLGFLGRYSAILNNAPFEGTAIHLFNPHTKLWSNYWADSRNGTMEVPVIGSFEQGTALFYANDMFKGKSIRIRFRWDISDKNNPVWEQAFSNDSGETWEVNWVMYYSRM